MNVDLLAFVHASTIGVAKFMYKLWNAQSYTQCILTGRISACVLSISLSSMDWWISHPNAGNTDRIAPWIGADIAGGIYGTVSWAIASTYTGNHDGGLLVIAIVGGAISSSTGIIGKLGKFLGF